jgi:hypothetical protein
MELVAKLNPTTVEFGSSMIVAEFQSGEGPPGSQQMRAPSRAIEQLHFKPPFVQNDRVVAEKWWPTTPERRPWSLASSKACSLLHEQTMTFCSVCSTLTLFVCDLDCLLPKTIPS